MKFTYENRPDLVSGYALGEIRSVLHRLKAVEMQRLVGAPGHGGYVNARSYTLDYLNDGATGFSKLRSLTECGTPPSACLPATTFVWQAGEGGFETKQMVSASAPAPDFD